MQMKTSGAKQIAERYVKALFEASGKAHAAVEKDLKALQAVLAASKELVSMLSNPLLTRAQQAEAMDAVLSAVKADKMTRQFVALLARQKRLSLLPEIIAIYKQEAAARRGEMKAEVVSAAPMEDADAAKIGERLSKTYGKKVIVETRQDPELLGGVVINIGSLRLDGSLSGKLRRLRNILKAA